MVGTIISTNPANQEQSQFVSGSQVFIPISGTMPVTIAGSLGSTIFVDVNSSTGADNISTGDDTLATRAFNLGYNLDNDQWTRLYSIPYNSGVNAAMMPTSGFGLLAVSQIVGNTGNIAEVWSADDDNMFDSDNLLQAGARLYGFRGQGTSGIWPRIRATYITSGRKHVDISGSVSGFMLLTAGLIVDEDGVIANITPSPNNDTESITNVGALNVLSKLYGYNRSNTVFSRIDAVPYSGDGGSEQSFALSVAVASSGRPMAQTNRRSFDDGSENDGTLLTTASLVGFDKAELMWPRIGARPTQSGRGWALLTSDTKVANNVDSSRNTITNLSGGTVLPDIGVVGTFLLQNESGNNVMNVGGNNTGDFPHSSQGYQLFGGQSMSISVQNSNQIAVWAATSGERVRLFSTNLNA